MRRCIAVLEVVPVNMIRTVNMNELFLSLVGVSKTIHDTSGSP